MGINTKEIKSFPELTHAFQISVGPAAGNTASLVAKVSPGTINNIIPSNIISNGKLREFPIQKDTMQYIIAKCNSNGKQINSATVQVKSSVPAAQTPVAFGLPSNVEVLLGVVYNNIIYQCVKDNISLGGYAQYLTPQENSTLPYTVFFIWGTKSIVV